MRSHGLTALLTLLSTFPAAAQTISLLPAERLELPSAVDSNSPAFWSGSLFHLFHSNGLPVVNTGSSQFSFDPGLPVSLPSSFPLPAWFESVWRDDDGTLLLWYHHEPQGLCSGNGLTAPIIGAAVSFDGGRSITDLGFILTSGDPLNCDAANGFFAGGHGDFSVILDRDRQFFYFLFSNYGGPSAQQGVAVARLAFQDRFHPAGALFKYFDGGWSEKGLGGAVTPIFPAVTPWESPNADSFWGPSIHFNTTLHSYIVLLNHACCDPGWPQEGIYISSNADLSHPENWMPPAQLLAAADLPDGPGYYPQVLGLDPNTTDTLAGAAARLYVQGASTWTLQFSADPPDTSARRP